MSWQLSVPHCSRSGGLMDVAEAGRALPAGEDRDVTRQFALGALTAASAGDDVAVYLKRGDR